MEEKAKCLAWLGFGALVGSVSTILLLKFRPRTVNGSDEKGGELHSIGPVSKTRTNCCAVSGNGNNKMAGVDLLSDEIVSEQLTRNIQFFGLEPQQKVTASYVVVIGLGGVGSHAASMLLRSGVGRLLLVDFDQVPISQKVSEFATAAQKRNVDVFGNLKEKEEGIEKDFVLLPKRFCKNAVPFLVNLEHELIKEYNEVIAQEVLQKRWLKKSGNTWLQEVSVSSLNRHAVATRADVGIPKAQCLKEHFLSIFPECHIDAKVLLYNESSEEEILADHPDFVLDCIDNIDTKVALLAACVRRGLNVLSATGAGARADPTRIRIADLRQSTNDPLSRSLRHRLRRDYGIEGGVTVVFSLEKPKAKLLPFKGPSGEEENPSDYQILPGFRVRIIPVLGTIPAIFGQVMASFVLTQLAGLQVQTEPIVNLDIDHYRMLHQRLIEHEESLYGTALHVQVDVEEVMYIAKELWHGRSAREPFAKDVGRGMWRSVNELMLVRWDREEPASVSNLILLKFKEADEHESSTLEDIKEREPEFFVRVTSVLKRAELEFGL